MSATAIVVSDIGRIYRQFLDSSPGIKMESLKAIPLLQLCSLVSRLFEIHRCNDARASTYGQHRCKEVPAVSRDEWRMLWQPMEQMHRHRPQQEVYAASHGFFRASLYVCSSLFLLAG
jgi:hypothetical protein